MLSLFSLSAGTLVRMFAFNSILIPYFLVAFFSADNNCLTRTAVRAGKHSHGFEGQYPKLPLNSIRHLIDSIDRFKNDRMPGLNLSYSRTCPGRTDLAGITSPKSFWKPSHIISMVMELFQKGTSINPFMVITIFYENLSNHVPRRTSLIA